MFIVHLCNSVNTMMLFRADRQQQLREALASSSAADEASVGLLDNEASPPVEPFVGQN